MASGKDRGAIMALDQGTTSSRTILFDRKGKVLAVAQQEFAQHYPKPGWVEHKPQDIWNTVAATAKSALRKAKLKPADIKGIGITNQRETTLLWDRATGKPVGPAIVWQCRRTADRCEAIRKKGDAAMLQERTGLVVDAYFSGTKLAWLLDEIPGARDRAERGELAFGTVDSWLIWNLTGGTAKKGAVHATDPSNASRTLLFDQKTQAFAPDLLDYFKIPHSVVPAVQPSSGILGETHESLFGGRIPIAAAIGDQQSALFGQTCFTAGSLKSTYGTGCFLLLNTGEAPVRSTNGLLTSTGWKRDGHTTFVLEGSVFVGGAVVQWLRDGLHLIKSAAETEAIARSAKSTGGVFVVPAFVGLGAPYWNSEARGAITGITRGTTTAQIVRAALEAIAFQTAEVVGLMGQEMGHMPDILRVDGGATGNNFLCQFQADVLGVPVERPKFLETTAAGAAYLAGLATGFWSSPEELSALRKVDRIFEPKESADWRASHIAGWKKAVQRVLM
jgi:glycerol kinase